MLRPLPLILGAHESISGGIPRALERGHADGCEGIQIFSKSSSQWAARPLSDEEIEAFRKTWRGLGRPVVAIHDAYLINLASPDEDLRAKSLEAFVEEIRRADALGVRFLVMHPGSPVDRSETWGIERIAAALNEAFERTPGSSVRVLLENTAGQGAHIGWRFEHLAAIIDGVRQRRRLGVCFDTQHAFAAGYDLRTRRGYEATLREVERTVGLERVRAFHLNDSKRPLGARVDRHEHIGQGAIGELAFRLLVNDERFADVPAFLETPGQFRWNLEVLKRMRRRPRAGRG